MEIFLGQVGTTPMSIAADQQWLEFGATAITPTQPKDAEVYIRQRTEESAYPNYSHTPERMIDRPHEPENDHLDARRKAAIEQGSHHGACAGCPMGHGREARAPR